MKSLQEHRVINTSKEFAKEDANVFTSFSKSSFETLRSLEKKRRLAENRMFFWLAVPILWLLAPALSALTDAKWVFVFGIIWLFLVLFGVGAWIYLVLPSQEELSKRYKKTVMPELLRLAGIEGEYLLSHGLKVDSFLKSGLYHEKYSHFERNDSVIGSFKGIRFGLYELGVQVASSLKYPGSMGPQTSFLTNNFYGWVLHVPVAALAGNTYIIPLQRKTRSETDDWIKATQDYFQHESSCKLFKTGDAKFDTVYSVYSSNPAESHQLLATSFREFLLLVFSESDNAPGFSFSGNRASMHLGISDNGFERIAHKAIYPPDTDAPREKLLFSAR